MARILAVDDERAILDALARVLGRDGHEVVREADPTAVPGMDLSRFDLVSVNLFFTSFAKQARRSRKGGFTGCANVFSPIPVTA